MAERTAPQINKSALVAAVGLIITGLILIIMLAFDGGGQTNNLLPPGDGTNPFENVTKQINELTRLTEVEKAEFKELLKSFVEGTKNLGSKGTPNHAQFHHGNNQAAINSLVEGIETGIISPKEVFTQVARWWGHENALVSYETMYYQNSNLILKVMFP